MLTLQININEIPDNKLLIIDTTGFIHDTNTTGFLPEESTPTDTNFKLSEVGLVMLSVWNAIDGDKLQAKSIVTKTTSQITSVENYLTNYTNVVPFRSVTLSKDGQHTIYYIVIPLKSKLDATPSLVGISTYTYCLTTDGKIVEYSNPTVAVDELTLIGTIANSNISNLYYTKELFNINYLQSCYLSYLYSIGFFDSPNSCKGDSGLKENKNLVLDAITVIKYYLESCDIISAQQLVENIMGCNDLCTYPTIDIGGLSCCQN